MPLTDIFDALDRKIKRYPTPPSHRRDRQIFPTVKFLLSLLAQSWWGYESITASRFSRWERLMHLHNLIDEKC